MMSCKRRLRARLVVAVGPVCIMLIGLGGMGGCSSYPTLKEVPVDYCTADDGYEFLSVSVFDTVGETAWWTSGDSTPNKVATASIENIGDGPRCDSQAAAVLRSAGNNDWGSLFGYNNFGPGKPAAAYEGMSFWARAPGNTTKGFTLLLDDPNTANVTGANCKFYGTGGGTGAAGGTSIDPNTGQTLSSGTISRAIYPDECGNGYTAVMLVTSEWRFYTVPFAAFHQDARPNRVPNALLTEVGPVPGTGLLTDQLKTFILRMPKEANTELWIDNLAFYNKKAQ